MYLNMIYIYNDFKIYLRLLLNFLNIYFLNIYLHLLLTCCIFILLPSLSFMATILKFFQIMIKNICLSLTLMVIVMSDESNGYRMITHITSISICAHVYYDTSGNYRYWQLELVSVHVTHECIIND